MVLEAKTGKHASSCIGLIHNTVLLLAQGLHYDMPGFWIQQINPLIRQLLTGLAAGGIGVAIMLSP